MPLFVCSDPDCRTVDNTALSPASWTHMQPGGRPLCTKCASGSWHESFAQTTYDPAAPIGSLANSEHLWVDGQWINERPKRTGSWQTVDGKMEFVYPDGFGPSRPGQWVDGQWAWDDER